MPKILINEEDFTTPGTPDSYANYSVLIAGLQKEFTKSKLKELREEIAAYELARQAYTIKLNELSKTPTKAEIDTYHKSVTKATDIYNNAIDCAIYAADKVIIEKPGENATSVELDSYHRAVEDFITKLPLLSDKAQLSADALMLLARDERADYNGVYEFSSAQDFLNTVGPVAAYVEMGEGKASYSHYGNQMAYELLKQGYTVIYMPVSKNNLVATLANEATWEIFKDKASYDFRFIHHGLLESTDPALLADTQTRIDSLTTTLQILTNAGVIEFDINKLTVKIGDDNYIIGQSPDQRFEEVYTSEQAYSELLERLNSSEDPLEDNNLRDVDGNYYTLGSKAAQEVLIQLQDVLMLKEANVDNATFDTVNTHIANLAKYVVDNSMNELAGRGDCVALIELNENAYVHTGVKPEFAIIDAINEMSVDASNGKYCALTVPSVVYSMSDATVSVNGELVNNAYGGNKKFPGGFHYLACFMNSLRAGFREWYAAAGYTRGVSSYSVRNTTVPLGEIAINALEPRAKASGSPKFACNVIANFRGSYYLWGNRTAHPLGTKASGGDLVASHFLNIRQLCCTIKKQLYVACRRFTFDPNSDTLWFNFVNAIKPTLEAMKADQGIRDYKIMKVTTDKKATLKAKIRIIPIEAVEDFDLTVSLEDSFGETAAVVTE